MEYLHHILRFCVIMLFSALGTNTALGVPLQASEITYSQPEIIRIGQGDNVGFAARAPPLVVPNVAATGGTTVMQGNAFALHGQETVAALFGFGDGFDATNRVPDVPAPVQIVDETTSGNATSLQLDQVHSQLVTNGSSNGRVLTQQEFLDEFGGN